MINFVKYFLLYIVIVPLAHADELTLKLEPSKLTIARFEPIFLRLAIENPAAEPFLANAPPSIEAGIVKVQLRRKGASQFKRIPALNENIQSLTAYRGPTEHVPSRGRRTTGIVLVETNRFQIFDEAGEFEVQVVFARGHGYPESVATMDLDVKPIAQLDWDITEETATLLVDQLISGAGRHPPDAKSLKLNLERLSKEGVARFGRVLVELALFRDSTTREDALAALNNIAKLRANCSSPERDWIAQRMGELYLRQNLAQLAREEIARLPTQSLERERFEGRLLLLPK